MRSEAEAERDRIKAALADSDSEAARIIADARASADQLAVDIEARTETDPTSSAAAACHGPREHPHAGRVGPLRRARPVSPSAQPSASSRVRSIAAAQQRLIDDYISQVGTQN